MPSRVVPNELQSALLLVCCADSLSSEPGAPNAICKAAISAYFFVCSPRASRCSRAACCKRTLHRARIRPVSTTRNAGLLSLSLLIPYNQVLKFCSRRRSLAFSATMAHLQLSFGAGPFSNQKQRRCFCSLLVYRHRFFGNPVRAYVSDRLAGLTSMRSLSPRPGSWRYKSACPRCPPAQGGKAVEFCWDRGRCLPPLTPRPACVIVRADC